ACPSCGRQLRVPDDLLGCMVKCPACAHNFAAPANEPAPSARRSAPASDRRDDEPRPTRRRFAEEEDQDRSSPQGRGGDADDDYEDDDVPRIRRRDEKPGKVQAIGTMMLIGGIWALAHGIIGGILLALGTCCFGLLWPGTYYAIVLGIMAIIKGSKL